MNSGRVSAVFVAGWMKTIELKAISGQLSEAESCAELIRISCIIQNSWHSI